MERDNPKCVLKSIDSTHHVEQRQAQVKSL
jgi:hypothetical protein